MWWEVALDVARRRFERVSDALFGAGASGVQEEHRPGEAPAPRQPWDTGPAPKPSERVIARAWFEDPDRERVAAQLGGSAGLDAGRLRWSPVADVDWEQSWKANFPVLLVSQRTDRWEPICDPGLPGSAQEGVRRLLGGSEVPAVCRRSAKGAGERGQNHFAK